MDGERAERLECLRRAAPDAPPAAMSDYVEKVRHRAHAIADADVELLRTAGYDEDAIFEATVGTALAEGLRRFDLGLSLLREAHP